MSFKVGDNVSVLDEAISGVIIESSGTTISIETEDGFVLAFHPNELVLESSSRDALEANVFTNSSLAKAVAEKEEKKRKQPFKKAKSKNKHVPVLEVDLHIHQLVKSTKGMSNFDMLTLQLDTAKRQLEFAINKRIQRIVFIHGVGEGVLKLELEYLFKRYDTLKYYDANYQKYGLGATEVYIYQNTSK